MTSSIPKRVLTIAAVLITVLIVTSSDPLLLAQEETYEPPSRSFDEPASINEAPPISSGDLSNLVAPIALYPDPLLGQILVASTYPLELVEAQQWFSQNRNLGNNHQLMDLAKRQDWDASVQALVAFPDVLALLNQNIRWTTDLGNAFLAQQAAVMDAIQSLRVQADENGRLTNTPELSVNTQVQDGRSAIEIQSADPQSMYVPAYNPSYVWGSPAQGSYPSLSYQGSGFGSLFQSVVNLAGMLPGFTGLGGNGWGWALNWLARTLFTNNLFLSNFGFLNFGGGYGGSTVWVHNNMHRLNVPYPDGFMAGRYRSGGRTIAPRNVGWRGSDGGRMPGQSSARIYSSSGWGGSGNSQWANRTGSPGNWHSYGHGMQASDYRTGRSFAPPSRYGKGYNRTSNTATSGAYSTPYTERQPRAAAHGNYMGSNDYRARPVPRMKAESSGPAMQPYRSTQSRKSFLSFWRQGSSAPQHSNKPQHFSAPKAQHSPALHFFSHSTSHGSEHSSRGRSGGKSRHKGR